MQGKQSNTDRIPVSWSTNLNVFLLKTKMRFPYPFPDLTVWASLKLHLIFLSNDTWTFSYNTTSQGQASSSVAKVKKVTGYNTEGERLVHLLERLNISPPYGMYITHNTCSLLPYKLFRTFLALYNFNFKYWLYNNTIQRHCLCSWGVNWPFSQWNQTCSGTAKAEAACKSWRRYIKHK